MRVLIENYRGFEINFDTETSEFYTELDDYGKRSKSFEAVKKGVDEFKKANSEFKPFKVIKIDASEILNIIGIRKDGRFYYEKNSEKNQLSDYYEDNYFVYDEKIHDQWAVDLAYLQSQKDDIIKKIENKRKSIQGHTLKSIKANYLI